MYESVVRRQVDPALLEWTAGNNFRSRVYPIPAKGYKRILIGFKQELPAVSSGYLYFQPFYFKDKVDEFKIRTEVFKQDVKPAIFGDSNVTLHFNKWEENWVAEKTIENYLADKPLSFLVPVVKDQKNIFVEKDYKGLSTFYLTIQPPIFTQEKNTPSKITLFWDMSGSSEKTDSKTILDLLDAYMKKASYPEIELVLFSNEVVETVHYHNKEEEWKRAVEKIKTLKPDGATQLGCLDLSKYKADEYILVSDGLSNFGKHKINVSSKPVYTICSTPQADYSYLKYLAVVSGGSFINLNTLNQTEALSLLISRPYQFISAEYDPEQLSEVYPSKPVNITGSFSMAGIVKNHSADIVLNFGIGEKILRKEKITIINTPYDYQKMIPAIWAQQKLAELDVFYEANQKEITSLGKEYGIVTRNTSLLILDNLSDYLLYKVEPKDPELKKQYLTKISENKRDHEEERKAHLKSVIEQFETWKKWYNTDYVYKKKKRNNLNEAELGVTDLTLDSAAAIELNIASTYLTDSVAVTSGSGTGNGNAVFFTQPEANFNANLTFRVDVSDENRSPSMKQEIKIGTWTSFAPYMKELKNTSKKDLYKKYLELRPQYQSTPSFFIDVSDYFLKQGEKKLALRILSNLAELELENHKVLRVLARRLQQMNENVLAIEVFKDVLWIREEEPQSYRDLGLAYSQNQEYQEAVNILSKVVNCSWDGRFPEIECIAISEINHIISQSRKKLRLDSLDKKLQVSMPCDIRVVINWDTDNCDMDLWVTDPNEEKCYYAYPLTLSGGKLSKDFTGGYGPEVFMIKNAVPGNYKIEVNYFGTREQSLIGPTTVQAEIYTNYGRPTEKKRVVTLRLEKDKEVVQLADIMFEKN